MEIAYEIFCDDARFEQNNKVSLMGLYSDRISINYKPGVEVKWPIHIRLTCYIRFKLNDSDPRPDSFTFSYIVNGKELPSFEGEMKVGAKQSIGNLVLTAQGLPLEVGAVGYKVSLKSQGETVFSAERSNALQVVTKATGAPAAEVQAAQQ